MRPPDLALVLSLVSLSVACTGEPVGLEADASTSVDPGPATARFELPRGAPVSEFYALPFPNDIRATDDGHIDLADHPRLNAIIGSYLDVLAAEQQGFGLASASYFLFDAAIDPASLPSPAGSRRSSASAYLIDVDPDSPTYAQRIPVTARFYPEPLQEIGGNFLALQPFPGFVLAERTTYAAVVTRRLRAGDGSAVSPAPELAQLLSDAPARDAYEVRARAIYQPLLDWLDAPGGDERADVVSAAVFTTGAPTELLGRIRQVIYRDVAPPRPRRVHLLGREAADLWFDGEYDGPVFQDGDVPYQREGGEILVDPDTGDPILQAVVPLRFSLTVPRGSMPEAGWPIVLYAHGTGGDYHSFHDDGTGARLAAAGLACISIDQVLHGPRNPGGNPEIDYFNLQNPRSARDNGLQGALDDFQLVRLVLGFDFVERHPGGRIVKFDRNRIFFFGHSQGSLTGIPFVAHEPLVRGAVFSGAAGLVYLGLLLKTEPLDIPGVLQLFIRDAPLDQWNPVINLLQLHIDRADPVVYAPLLVERPPAGNTAKNVFYSEGLVDHYAPDPGCEAIAAATGADLVRPVLQAVDALDLGHHGVLEAPIADNRGEVGAFLLQYRQAQGSDGHFVVFDVPAAGKQSVQFLKTLSESGTAWLVAP